MNKNIDTTIVSILCITYNHENYVEKAILSFLSQKTKYKIEIIIHDDASTDKTREIVRKFSEKYPDLIRCIFPPKNRYSKTYFRFLKDIFKLCNGKYIAFCEGDDFWINDNKITLQVDVLEKNPTIDMCFHPSIAFNDITQKFEGIVSLHHKIKKIIEHKKILYNDGSFCPTASLMCSKERLISIPDWAYDAPIFDYFIQSFCSENGCIFLPIPMSVYRKYSRSSLVDFISESDSKYITYYEKMNTLLEKLKLHYPIYKKYIEHRKYTLSRNFLFSSSISINKRDKFFISNWRSVTFLDIFQYLFIRRNKNIYTYTRNVKKLLYDKVLKR